MKVSTFHIMKSISRPEFNRKKLPVLPDNRMYYLPYFAGAGQHILLVISYAEKQDSLYSMSVSILNISVFDTLVSENFEFYHDQAGMMLSKAALLIVKNNVCSLV
jgi:hypothetical protein